MLKSTPTPQSIYQTFLSECPEIYRCSYGDGIAIAFAGPRPKIDLMINLVSNFHLDEDGKQRALPSFTWHWDEFVYFPTSSKKIIKTIARYLDLRFRMINVCWTGKYKEKVVGEGEDEVVYRTQIHDEEEISKLSQEFASRWYNEHVKFQSFIATTPNAVTDYTVSFAKEDGDEFLDLVNVAGYQVEKREKEALRA